MITAIIYVLVTVLVLIISIVIVRTLRIKYKPAPYTAPEPCDIDMDAAIRGLQSIIRIPTVSHRDDSLIDHSKFKELHDTLSKLFPNIYRVCEIHEFPTSILYRWSSSSAAATKDSSLDPILLMAHVDVVPPGDPTLWEHDPFSGDIVDGVLWGRGTIDTKTTAFSLLFGVEDSIRRNRVPKRDIFMSLSHNEEIQGNGIFNTISYFKEHNIHLSLVLDEGGAVYTNAPVLNIPAVFVGIAEKGYCDIRVTSSGTGGHASMPPDHTALGTLARAITLSESHPYTPRIPEPLRRTLAAVAPRLPFALRIFCANLWLFGGVAVRAAVRFLPQGNPLSAMLRTTVAWTMARGSGQSNVLPKTAEATANLRLLAPETPEGARRRMEAVVGGLGVEVEVLAGFEQDPVSQSWGWQWEAVEEAARDVWGGETVVAPFLLMGSTDSSHVARAGLCEHVYRLTPFQLDVKLVHNVNERVDVKSVKDCVEFYVRLLDRFTDKK